jgi:putative phosphoserine phosphatase/1-acylglycerol-3-phosphate O-acyltransferase
MIGAFFDMDNTLLSASSGMLYLRYLRQHGYLPFGQWAQIMTWVGLYIAGAMRFPAMMSRLMVLSAGSSEAEAWRMSNEWFQAMLRHYIAPGARTRVAWHRAQGHQVAIVSASTPYAVHPVAQALGLGEAYLSTRLEVIDGRFTGRVIMPACDDDGKVILARDYAVRHGIDLAQSYFYSDSHRDLPLLEAVGRPVAVNPNRRLARIAAARGWPVMRFY